MMESAKVHLHNGLRGARAAVVGKLDGLSEYDMRRPLTATGTNLLGLVNHLAVWEAVYLGDVFGRPFADLVPSVDHVDEIGDDHWVPADEPSDAVIARFERVCEHADQTIRDLHQETVGHVGWWPKPDVTLLSVLVHLVAETNRHAGHADILREQIDGRTGFSAADQHLTLHDQGRWDARVATIEAAAKNAASRNGLV